MDLVDYAGNFFRQGKASISAELAGILERLNSSAQSCHVRLEKLRGDRLLGNSARVCRSARVSRSAGSPVPRRGGSTGGLRLTQAASNRICSRWSDHGSGDLRSTVPAGSKTLAERGERGCQRQSVNREVATRAPRSPFPEDVHDTPRSSHSWRAVVVERHKAHKPTGTRACQARD
jgi:hypothetical protein